MQRIDKYYFDRALKDSGSYESYYKETRDMCYLFPYSAKGKIMFQDFLMLPKLNKYYLITIEILFQNSDRSYKITCVDELTLDEYLNMSMEEREVREACNEIFKYIR